MLRKAVFILIFLSSFARAEEYVVKFKPQTFHSRIARKINETTAVMNATSREGLLKISGVELVEPNYIYEISKMPNDPMFTKQWSLYNFSQTDSGNSIGTKGIDLNMPNAWQISTGSKSVVVAVIDTGIDFKIPDLKNNAWVNQAERDGLPGVDDDKNGYIDDINGFNFVANNGDATDDNGHGSHCAGVIGAQGDDGVGIAGINWQVSLMAVKFISKDGTGTLENAIKAVDYARKNGAQIMSNSWGGLSESAILQQSIAEANALFVVAAGNNAADNDQVPSYPASYTNDNVLAVASINNRGRPSSFSNFGAKTVHIAAPGENILSTTPEGFESMSGTSMATPHVAGVAALLLANEPTLTYLQLKTRIIENARPLYRLRNKVISAGMLDAFAVLTNTKPGPDDGDPKSLGKAQSSSVSSPHPYAASSDQTYKISIAGANHIAIHFARFELETNFDYVEILDAKGNSHDKMSGFHNGEFTDIIDGDTIYLHMTSDKTVNGYGFDVDEIDWN